MNFRFWKKKKTEDSEAMEELDALSEDNDINQIKQEIVRVEPEKVDLNDTKSRVDYLNRLHDAIRDAKRQCGDIKFEYGQVTSYLKDIQLIDQAPDEEKQGLYAAAGKIVELTEERQHIQKQKYKLSDAQKRAMENYEANVPEDIKKLLEYEDYQMKIKNDLRQLNGEKSLLNSDRKDIVHRQRTLKTIGKCLTVILIALGAMLAALTYCFHVDITMPFIGTVAFGFVIAAIILSESRKNRIDMVITEKKCSRAIALSNKVKIKYVNNVRTLDYMCHKYQVRNAVELDFVYGQYLKAKKEWARQREGTILINENNQILMHELMRLGVKDRDIWYSQARALVDAKEMVEVRHDLNVRRQKLRDQLDYNTGVMEECLDEMQKIRDKNPQYAEEVELILSQGG